MAFKRTTAINKIRRMKTPWKVVQGGTYAGKTYAIIPILIDYAIKHKGKNITVVASTIPSVKRGAMKIFLDVMRETGRFAGQKRWNKSERIYTFSNGSTIEFTSFDSVQKAREAGKRDVLFLNEGNFMPYPLAMALIERTDEHVYIDYNPDAEFWAHTDLLTRKKASMITLTYKDNEALGESALENLLWRKERAEEEEKSGTNSNVHRNWWNVYGLGKVGQIEGLCYPEVKVVDEIPRDARLEGYGIDWGYVNDPTVLVAMYKQGRNIYFDELIYQTGLRASRIRELAKMHQVRIGETTIADNDNQLIDEVRFADKYPYWDIRATKKPANAQTYGINLLNDYNIHLTRRSKNGLKERTLLKWAKDREGKTLNKPEDGNDHFWDAARYIGQYKLSYKFR